MKNYSERFGQILCMSFDPATKTFVETPVDQLRFMPCKLSLPEQQKPREQEALELRYAAE